MRKTCSICSAAPDVQRLVDEKLRAGVYLKAIAQETGFSKSAVHRHSKNCIARLMLAENRAQRKRNSLSNKRVVVAWPNGRLTICTQFDARGLCVELDDDQRELAASELDADNDVLFRIVLKPHAIKNPPALTLKFGSEPKTETDPAPAAPVNTN